MQKYRIGKYCTACSNTGCGRNIEAF